MGDRPVVFRTLDVGGDKPAAWQSDRPEANPALGVRGVRLGLDRPALLDDQLRALVEAAGGGEVRIMLPMVSTVEEVVAVRARLDAILASVELPPSSVQLGVMIEVPSAALVADGFAEVAGLLQHRDQRPRPVHAGRRPDESGPGRARVAATTGGPAAPGGRRRRSRERGRPVAVCGEAAADPD